MRSTLLLFFLAIVGAACGARTPLPDVRPRSPLCGNGVVDPGEECDLGAGNSDAISAFAVTQNGVTFQVHPLARDKSASDFYDYVGASSFTGLEVQAESRIYLYLDERSSQLSLIVNHNIFNDGTGSASMHVTGLPRDFKIDLSDDDGELERSGDDSADGNWQWWSNTDGGVIGGLCGPWTKIEVAPSFTEGISTWVWVDGDGTKKPLDLARSITLTMVPQCHTDCTYATSACGP